MGLIVGFAIADRYKARKWLRVDLEPAPVAQSAGSQCHPHQYGNFQSGIHDSGRPRWTDQLRLPAISELHIALAPFCCADSDWSILLVILATIGLAAVKVFFARWTPRRAAAALDDPQLSRTSGARHPPHPGKRTDPKLGRAFAQGRMRVA